MLNLIAWPVTAAAHWRTQPAAARRPRRDAALGVARSVRALAERAMLSHYITSRAEGRRWALRDDDALEVCNADGSQLVFVIAGAVGVRRGRRAEAAAPSPGSAPLPAAAPRPASMPGPGGRPSRRGPRPRWRRPGGPRRCRES